MVDALVMEKFWALRKRALKPLCLLLLLGKTLDLVWRAGEPHGPTMLQLRVGLLLLAVKGGGNMYSGSFGTANYHVQVP